MIRDHLFKFHDINNDMNNHFVKKFMFVELSTSYHKYEINDCNYFSKIFIFYKLLESRFSASYRHCLFYRILLYLGSFLYYFFLKTAAKTNIAIVVIK